MSKVIVALILLFTMALPANALTARPQPMPTPLVAVVAVLPIMWIILDAHMCDFVALSVAPDWPPDRQKLALGNCPPRATPR